MVKDISAGKRLEYTQQISEKIQKLEDLKSEERNIFQAIEKYQETMKQSFSNLQELNEELVNQGSRTAQMDMDANQEMLRFVRNMVDEQKEGVSETYSKLKKEVEDDIENLQHKRNALLWEEPKSGDRKE
ncbi:hypothetical protein ACJDT4_20715 [Clostridium neuense]|uniref:Uncharacterized protein n=1 Tax=Clostridium neuense TaxID=1728934 RepID=A0ABW8TK55_9CLOT